MISLQLSYKGLSSLNNFQGIPFTIQGLSFLVLGFDFLDKMGIDQLNVPTDR